MLSCKQRQEMLDAYERAHSFVEAARLILEDQSAVIAEAGEPCCRNSVKIIGDMSSLRAALRKWINFFEANAEVSE